MGWQYGISRLNMNIIQVWVFYQGHSGIKYGHQILAIGYYPAWHYPEATSSCFNCEYISPATAYWSATRNTDEVWVGRRIQLRERECKEVYQPEYIMLQWWISLGSNRHCTCFHNNYLHRW